MIINRIIREKSDLLLCGLTAAGVQDRYLSPHDIADRGALIAENGTEILIYDDVPLVTEGFLARIAEKSKRLGMGFKIGEGFVRPQGYVGENIPVKSLCATVLSTETYPYILKILKKRIISEHKKNGVIILDENSLCIDFGVKIAKGAIIRPRVTLIGETQIGCSVIKEGTTVENSFIGNGCTVGPLSYLRGGAVVGDNCRIGDFVEIKNSTLHGGVKAAHLAYIGDAEVGENTNVGCGTVFCNYDGKTKHRTKVGKNVFIGANTNLVAPITIGDNAFIAAGGTVTEDVQNNAFVIARSRQTAKNRK